VSELDWAALVKDSQDLVLPDGDYNVLVADADATRSANGKPMYKTKLRVIDGPKKDRLLLTQFTVSAENPFALRIFFQQMAAFGLTTDYFITNPPIEQVAANLLNRLATVTVSTREFQGSDRNQVDQVRPYQGGGPMPPGVVTGPPVAGATAGSPVGGPPVPTAPSAPPTAVPTAAPPSGPPVPVTPF
jgi:uncharacterized protein DUF669